MKKLFLLIIFFAVAVFSAYMLFFYGKSDSINGAAFVGITAGIFKEVL